MDSSEATKIVFSRIQSLDPENASKIIGYIFIHDPGEKEMIRLAFGPDTLLLSLIDQAKTHLGLSSNGSSARSVNSSQSPFSPISNPNRPNPFPRPSPRIVIPNNGYHSNPASPSSPWSVSGFSDHRSPRCQFSPRPASSLSYAAVVNGTGNGASAFSPPSTSSFPLPTTLSSFSLPPFRGNSAFSNDMNSDQSLDFADPIRSPSGRSDSFMIPYGSNWVDSGNCGGNPHVHRRSCSVSDVGLGGVAEDGGNGLGWRPCMYFARGFCKNGDNCKFLHDGFADIADSSAAMLGSPGKLHGFDELLRMKAIQQERFAAASQFMAGGGPFPYNVSPRSAAAALMMGEQFHKFGRERNDFLAMGLEENLNSSSRQIYLTFPADSTFNEEDVSNYFSKFGPVHDVRIPYQQKRMFGFVSFVSPETVKIILAKGNPHFVCDSRVLVKPYKEKGKVPDRKQQNQLLEREEFSSCGLDCGEPYDLPIGARMFYNSSEMMLRRKLEEQAELQQALELQERRLMNLHLMNLKDHHARRFQTNMAPAFPICSPAQPHFHMNQSLLLPSDSVNQEVLKENCISQAGVNFATITADQQEQEVKEVCGKSNSDDIGTGKEHCSNPGDDDHHESFEHILPDNLFASPTKSAGDRSSIFSAASAEAEDSSSVTTTFSSNNIQMLPATSALKSCYFQMPGKVE